MSAESAFERLCFVFLEPSTTLLLVAVVAILVLASYRSQSFSLALQDIVAHEAETSTLNVYAAIAIPIAGSLMLLALFFFLDMMYYFLVVLFGFSAVGSTMIFVHPTVVASRRALFPRLPEQRTWQIRGRACGVGASIDAVVCGVIAVGCAVGWLLTKYWVLVDFLAVAMAVQAIATLRVPSLKVAALLLIVFFIYDVFWVFLSPFLFSGKSVMVEVAVGVTGASIPLPMLILVPKFFSNGSGLLGLGDIVLPGILLAFLFRHDFETTKRSIPNRVLSLIEILPVRGGYFVPCLTGYAIGLVVTFAALAITQLGQPALLYLVPFTLGPALILAAKRGELGAMWRRKPEEAISDDEKESKDVEMQDLANAKQ